MKKALFFLILASSLSASGQTIDRQESIPAFLAQRQAKLITGSYNFISEQKSVTQNIREYFLENLAELRNRSCDLLLTSERESPLGFHFTFVQTFKGKPVWGSELKVNTDKHYQLLSAFNGLFPLPETEEVNPFDLWYYNGKELQSATKEQSDHFTLIRDSKGHILYKEDRNKYLAPPDSLVQMKVFMPDPLTSAGVSYGSPYVDSNDVDIPQLNAQRQLVMERVHFSNDTFWLMNRYFKYEEFSSPVTPITFSKTPSFDFTRSQSGFEDVNSYYHLETYRKHVDSLGFGSLIYDSMLVDAHALGSSDLSMYSSYNGQPAMYYGPGGIDDAEDPDVVIHEYTHSIIERATVTINLSNERKAMDEAICDYMAIAYSKHINEFNWKHVFNWDGNNSSIAWFGRDAGSTKTYPYDDGKSYYWNCEIFSGTLADLDGRVGSLLTEKILLSSLPFMNNSATMKQMCTLMLQSDSILYNQAHSFDIQLVFFNRLIIDKMTSVKTNPAMEPAILNSGAFAKGQADLIISSPDANTIILSCHDILGRTLFSDKIFPAEAVLSPQDFEPGVYIITVKTKEGIFPLKIVRY